MPSLKEELTRLVAGAFTEAGFDPAYGEVVPAQRPEWGQFQCNGALAAASQYQLTPRQMAAQVVDKLRQAEILTGITIGGPGFINFSLTDAALGDHVQAMAQDERLGCGVSPRPLNVIVDYGGANIAKPMHVGHLRAAIIGESLKRLARFVGHRVLGDVHLGDWGLPMGLIIAELSQRQPELPYFEQDYTGPYPAESPVTIDDLEEIYPAANRRAKEEPAFREAARQATFALQQGRPGYNALWRHFIAVSIAELRADYTRLNVHFELWLGESDTNARVAPLIERLAAEGYAYESNGATIVAVSEPEDRFELPPLILAKSDGAILYGTTDLATLEQRVEDYGVELALYVVDNRQSDHFRQVFRAAYKTGVVPPSTRLEHINFGTMNGKDGKPFRTRTGGVMKLKELIELVTAKALERMNEINISRNYDEAERLDIARKVGVAALKFADLSNHYSKDYIFDLDRFSSFEGRTGPYLLYTAVRIKSILRTAGEKGLGAGPILPPVDAIERDVLLKLAELPDKVNFAFEQRAPNHLCEYVYTLATAYNRFYHDHHILQETDLARQAAWLGLSQMTLRVLTLVLELLGIETPERM